MDADIDQWLNDGGPCPIGPEPVILGNGPALWDAMLATLSVEGALICGGCIRDYLLGLEVKDIDIFVPMATREELAAFGEKLTSAGLYDVCLIVPSDAANDDSTGEWCPDLIGVLDGQGLGYAVNIIARTAHLEGRYALVDSFDFGIVQWAYDGTITGTLAAHKDLADKTATMLSKDDRIECSYRRWDRFAARNPTTLTLVAPPRSSDGDLDFAF